MDQMLVSSALVEKWKRHYLSTSLSQDLLMTTIGRGEVNSIFGRINWQGESVMHQAVVPRRLKQSRKGYR